MEVPSCKNQVEVVPAVPMCSPVPVEVAPAEIVAPVVAKESAVVPVVAEMVAAAPVCASAVQAVVKKVHFLPEVSVVLIPSLTEYKEAHPFESLWYNGADFKRFQTTMVHALNQYMFKIACFDKRQAFKLLILDDTFEADESASHHPATPAPRS